MLRSIDWLFWIALAVPLVLHLADWLQTRWIVTEGRHRQYPGGPPGAVYVELNPFLGRAPGLLAVDLWFLWLGAVLFALVVALPSPFGVVLALVWALVEGFYAVRNASRGIRFFAFKGPRHD
jgi:hypothetical protein